MVLTEGFFYFIKDQYFADFQDKYLMTNKEILNGNEHNRPCFYAFKDTETCLYWLIPFSSQIEKFERIYQNKIIKYGHCDTICFGKVLGYQKAFLIQNMCPITDKYLQKCYTDSKNNPIRMNKTFEEKLIKQAKKVMKLQRQGYKLIFPDVLYIESVLLKQMNATVVEA